MALFNHAVTWLRRNRVLLPGVSVLARQVSEARTVAERRVYEAASALRTGSIPRSRRRLLHPQGFDKSSACRSQGQLAAQLVSIPLTDEERAAVDDGQSALDALLERLADVATPDGPTPRELRAEPGRPLPLTSRSPTHSTDRKCC